MEVLTKKFSISFMQMQHTIMQLSERLNRFTRLHLMFIFLQSFFLIIFNSYNLVMYVLRYIANRSVEFGLVEALLFYGYQIVAPLFEVVVTVAGFSFIYSSVTIHISFSIFKHRRRHVRPQKIHEKSTQFKKKWLETLLKPIK